MIAIFSESKNTHGKLEKGPTGKYSHDHESSEVAGVKIRSQVIS
eukprot:NODE_34402_length_183_cov_1.492537_g33232_i0.p1 GENE.NODE_34402_length_183_cov_1.492537_g33232_i0~~NODE_34402_length_183_cov_1.492537_g33232_i0.p1  ORF type:complete len:52 (+),score=2.12 NODE_34402_length_183_cov_1.492537_g33232_i0:26-157(+)